jgi:hypothetical protein
VPARAEREQQRGKGEEGDDRTEKAPGIHRERLHRKVFDQSIKICWAARGFVHEWT